MSEEKKTHDIRDINGDVIYKVTPEELEEVLINILSSGAHVKTFSLYGGKLELTYTSISEKDRMFTYDEMKKYADKNEGKLSKIDMDSYSAKVNIAYQLIRIKTNGNVANIAGGPFEERMALLCETPEDVVRVYSKYLMIFANITAMAFNNEEILKN
jgi:hypothetical protein